MAIQARQRSCGSVRGFLLWVPGHSPARFFCSAFIRSQSNIKSHHLFECPEARFGEGRNLHAHIPRS